jgi:hypothetical protein
MFCANSETPFSDNQLATKTTLAIRKIEPMRISKISFRKPRVMNLSFPKYRTQFLLLHHQFTIAPDLSKRKKNPYKCSKNDVSDVLELG